MALALFLVLGIILIKYKPLYEVEINDKQIGYVKNKNEFNSLINEYIQSKSENVAFITLNSKPEYELKLVSNKEKANEEEILEEIKQNSITTYTAYGITIDNDIKTYVNTPEEAENILNIMKQQYGENSNVNIGIRQVYTEQNIETVQEENAIQTIIKIANTKIEEVTKQKQEEEKKKNGIGNVNGLVIANKPITGMITARFGENSRVRSTSHTGLDIATSTGTPIKVVANGTVIFAAEKGSYGKIVKVEHENGVQTWYAHCSKLYVKSGDKVSAGETIAAVGSTGNSTGSHLHLEIRINGKAVNPQKYLYK